MLIRHIVEFLALEGIHSVPSQFGQLARSHEQVGVKAGWVYERDQLDRQGWGGWGGWEFGRLWEVGRLVELGVLGMHGTRAGRTAREAYAGSYLVKGTLLGKGWRAALPEWVAEVGFGRLVDRVARGRA